jgi:hypothetical protein
MSEDAPLFNNFTNVLSIDPFRLLTVESIEMEWALIRLAARVYTDRYHPGVATLINEVPLSVVKYPKEDNKNKGLHMMKEYTPTQIRAMNDQGFEKLKNVLLRSDTILQELGLKGGEELVEE